MAQHAAVGELVTSSAPLALIRADAGLGGTRLLQEVQAALSPGRSLYLCTAGAEPLGALRNAFARSVAATGAMTAGTLDPADLRGLEQLLAGEGIEIALGAQLVARWVAPSPPAGPGAVLVDDALEVDDPTLDVIVQAAELAPGAFRLVVRLDADAPLPVPLASLLPGPNIRLAALDGAAAEELAASVAPEQLGHEEAARWARRGRHAPLGIVEAITWAATAGELGSAPTADADAEAFLVLEAKEWVQRRLYFVPDAAKRFLQAVAVLGLEAKPAHIRDLMTTASFEATPDAAEDLENTDWLRREGELYRLTSRTHREVVLEDIPDEERRRWHAAASVVVEKTGGKLASAEAARHATLSGDHSRAVELALAASKASRARGLDDASEALLAFVAGNPRGFAALPQPTTVVRLESWIEALRATGDHDGAASRLEAIALLAKGETAAALSSLRESVAHGETAALASRSRASLAYGIALAVAGRRNEALHAALEALARAREGKEPRGEQACARFLARLSLAAGHSTAAAAWQKMAGQKNP